MDRRFEWRFDEMMEKPRFLPSCSRICCLGCVFSSSFLAELVGILEKAACSGVHDGLDVRTEAQNWRGNCPPVRPRPTGNSEVRRTNSLGS